MPRENNRRTILIGPSGYGQRGFRILRFWDDEVLKNIDAVKEAVFEALCF